jgi:hypothetical protein
MRRSSTLGKSRWELIHDRLIEARELIAVINAVIKQKIVRMRSLPSAASACLTLSGDEGC